MWWLTATRPNPLNLRTTRNQSYNDDDAAVWSSERRKTITSSNEWSIAKQRSATPVGRMVSQLLYSTFRGNSATRWGLEQEKYSVSAYKDWLHDRGSPNPIVNIKCRLTVWTAHPWLAATPHGCVIDPTVLPTQGLVEFKNPYSYRHLSVSDAINARKCDCLEVKNSRIQLKHNHSYYYQVQLATFCTSTQWCDFLLCTTVDYQSTVQPVFLHYIAPYLEVLLNTCFSPRTFFEGQVHPGTKRLV